MPFSNISAFLPAVLLLIKTAASSHEEPHIPRQCSRARTPQKHRSQKPPRTGFLYLTDSAQVLVLVSEISTARLRNIFLAHLINMQILIIHTLLKIKKPRQKQMRQSPPSSAAQLGRASQRPLALPMLAVGALLSAAPRPRPVPPVRSVPSRGSQAPSLLQHGPSLQTSAADVKISLHSCL